MSRIQKERDRLLAATARTVGLTASATALVCLSIPGTLPLPLYLASLVLLACLAYAQFQLGTLLRSTLWMCVIVVAGSAIVLVNLLPMEPLGPSALSVVGVVGAVGIACLSVLSVTSRARLLVLIAAAVVTLAATFTTLIATHSRLAEPVLLIVAGWVALTATGVWLARTVPRTLKRISTMSRAYRVERQASETEARRRQGARLLHDTVLATLTLLAHSGVGVGVGALREQAAEDAALLRQLRLGFTPDPTRSGDYRLKPVEESTLGNTLESVKQRFRRMGLEVNWHGSGQVLLPSDVLDSFLLALGECLENVRRHSGVNEAHVTITDDETTVRAMVTDAGKGFDVGSIEEGRLGYTESIVARLRDVGGNARLFSSPGSGTTVVLEVPK
ncbi:MULTISPECIES: sensor histidine kinase [Leifsonia]|uniref:ATPase/histidine kinase/DNA gyrase B/HSP90 domain protein n=3 Tax=Leifsonia TaxID=110932 RepID=U2RKV2_LEIAQ|nr:MULTISPECIES: ATP-binding protein [Leifsonia]ERK69481.1 ATPase/histidine kinase/DNA gyrase B/HSP90 domain protein [Leifsonia aquatica ATCC 14665]MBB2965535.1 signal transduction histidine kinase [Leifsonia aquatica]NYK08649.1 signal transduction histidine kinase [Leifsonia naganoensis]